MFAVQSKMASAGPCTLHVLEAGAAGAAAVVLLHGMKFKAETWRDL